MKNQRFSRGKFVSRVPLTHTIVKRHERSYFVSLTKYYCTSCCREIDSKNINQRCPGRKQ